MKVKILGGGPAGLYAGFRIKRQFPHAEVDVFEQNAPDETFGFGVVFSDKALEFLASDDPETLAQITAGLETWSDIELRVHAQSIRIDGVVFTAIARLRLLQLLREQARGAGVVLHNQVIIRDLSELGDADLIIGADGVNSLVRRTFEQEFGTEVDLLNNRFAWFGATKPFQYLTQTFKQTLEGAFNAHHYRYSPEMSTFLVEVNEDTFNRIGFGNMTEEESRQYCQHVFAEELGEAKLVTNKSLWRQFPNISNARWSVGKHVLIGDALRTAHFSIGSGTRLALEDVQALTRALSEHPTSIAEALAAFEAGRKPIVDKLITASKRSSGWYEQFEQHLKLPTWDFAMGYISRSGRIDMDRLNAMSPQFVANYEASRRQAE